MFRRKALLLATALITIVAFYLQRNGHTQVEAKSFPGRNNTILFLSNGDPGLANVLLAASYSLLVEHSNLEVHYGTFKKFKNPIQDINKWAVAKSAGAGSIQFHQFKGLDYAESYAAKGLGQEYVMGPPGLAGFKTFKVNFHNYLMPWDAPDYLEVYNQAVSLIEQVNPAVVVADFLFSPGIDAIRALGRREVIMSPNSMKDVFGDQQPRLSILWKYPFVSSGFRFPLKWHQIPANIYMLVRAGYQTFFDPILVSRKAWLQENGIKNPLNSAFIYNKEITFICGGSLDSEFPMSVIPSNAVLCGPTYLSSAPVSEQDPELAKWMEKAPTVLINLGSRATYTEEGAREMVKALKQVLDTSLVQILWKFNKYSSYSDDFLSDVSEELASGRLRLEKWLMADPASILESGDVVLFVHHGGANCYHEGVGTGVPQLVLPMWADCYDYATRAEYHGIGVWGNEKSAPYWTSKELAVAFSKVLGNGTEAVIIREKAAALGRKHQAMMPGKSIAAREIAKLARLGQS